MSFVFAIRDDDTNFFTTPDELTESYADVWDVCPPTLSLISHVKGNWRYWMSEIYAHGKNIDWEAWWKDNEDHPLGDNKELVAFLKEKNKAGKFGFSFHAIHHRADKWQDPKAMANNFVLGAEFFTELDKTKEINDAVAYLNQLLQTRLCVATPPQNLLSEAGYQAMLNNRLNINGSGISFLKKIKGPADLIPTIGYMLHKATSARFPYHKVLKYRQHSEVISYFPLYPTTDLEYMKAAIDHFAKNGGVFVLSTHYHEFFRKVNNTPYTLKEGLLKILEHVATKKGVQYKTLSEVFHCK
jgi:hypothetical protein